MPNAVQSIRATQLTPQASGTAASTSVPLATLQYTAFLPTIVVQQAGGGGATTRCRGRFGLALLGRLRW